MRLSRLAFFFGLLSAAFADAQPPLQTVDHVDLNRYIGKWYEIARYPNRFEKDCASDITAQYTLLPDRRIEVLNSCRQSDGKLKSSKGKAKVVDAQTNAKLKVTFFWPFYGAYWIIALDPHYRYAVISEPKREYLWILSRTPHLAPDLRARALEAIRAQRLDPAKLIEPQQSGN